MIIPAEVAPDAIEAQIVVVGAGPAGMALALDLARRGVDVALISDGSFAPDSLSPALSRAESRPEHHVDPATLEARRLGGLSWSWGGRCVAPEPLDFEPRPELGLPGWPITRAELLARADDAAAFLGVGAPSFADGDDAAPPGLRATLERWAAEPRLAVRHRAALEAAGGPRVYLDLAVAAADVDEIGAVAALTAIAPGGRAVQLKAARYVLAAGGLETSRLLLHLFESNGRPAPRWTGRGYMGHLSGRVLRIRPTARQRAALGYFRADGCWARRRLAPPEALLREKTLPSIAFRLDNPHPADPAHRAAGLSLAYLALTSPALGPRLAPGPMRGFLTGDGPRRAAAHLAYVLRDPVEAARFGLAVWRGRRAAPIRPGTLARTPGGWLPLAFSAEERPLPENRIALGRERDAIGLPRLKIDRRLHPDDLAGAAAAQREMVGLLRRAGFEVEDIAVRDTEIRLDIERSSGDGYHQIGGARMGLGPEDSVTDADCRVHGLANLHVAGAAAFPRSGQANPTFAIICLALRLAAHLARRR